MLRLFGDGLTLKGIIDSLKATAQTTGMIFFILFGAAVLGSFFSRAGLPAAMASWAGASGLDPWVILIAMLLILIVMGCFMDSLAMILVVVPFFWPVLMDINGGMYVTAEAAAFGLNAHELRIWFGILALVVVELGLITPPVGLNVFIISSLAQNVSMNQVFRGVMPFFSIEIVRVALLILAPPLCLYLPRLLSS